MKIMRICFFFFLKKKIGGLTMIWNCLRNRKYDEHLFEIYLSLIFLYSRILWDFCGNENYVISQILRILRYLIDETV